MNKNKAFLVLSTGDVLAGKWLSEPIQQEGEMVFNTAMTGYQEVITDPSYAGQIVTLTYPLIGNYGCNDHAKESIYTALAGLIIATPCFDPEHSQSHYSLQTFVKAAAIPALYDIDTRALTKIIREHGEIYGRITDDPSDCPKQKQVNPNVVEWVSVKKQQHFQALNNKVAKHVVVFDYGHKQSITGALLAAGCDVTVVPYDTPYTEIQALDPDAVVFSNGPGDPKSLTSYLPTVKAVAESYPTLGICLGHQLIALAFGAETIRLPYGHRGSNHPVKDMITGKVMMTSQNHGYVVAEESVSKSDWQITHINVNDQSVEGLKHKSKTIQTVQFHPEAHPGPVDTHYIFEAFIDALSYKGEKQHA
ncbi:carbamoyl-phosphate synthase small subunit [Amphibacillus marinus]|uniref:Carbamoyl phosphate synthase small chain n=1 Tax=Amphibacillus marinus TaxID=872970 RepID=A0A1H8JX36_9BACI|nr:carbamoyl phosphate synthase small subunit [Amphibacillus marinus]SEN84957.1 carbamoyl-phosphate synthase small subunit [Amphibacillus marinus]